MLRRNCRRPVVATAALASATRAVTSRGQFNPIHAFTEQSTAPAKRAGNEREFEMMITNPGPVRVTYSPDYLDWLYRAYRAKLQYADERKKAEEVFQGLLLTTQPDTHGGAAGAGAQLPGAPLPGHTLRPRHSVRRQAGEVRRAAAQAKLDALAQQQGMLDVFERQPQFPAVHIDTAARYHVVELFKEMVLDRAWEPEEVWDKALLYRAILAERQASYPASYRYILETAREVTLVLKKDSSSPSSAAANSDVAVAPSTAVTPSEEDYTYFLYLVRRYYIDNAVEGHVVLRCHRRPDAAEVLFSDPPPKDEQEVLRGIYGQSATPAEAEEQAGAAQRQRPPRNAATAAALVRPRPPEVYPPVEALWRCAENEALLRVLVFGELNLLVSEDPFVRFPNARAHLTRPSAAAPVPGSSTDAAEGPRGLQYRPGSPRRSDGGVTLASIIAEKRGHLLAPLSRNVATMVDGRANDVRRLQQRYEREDTASFQKLLRGGAQAAEENPGLYSAYSDWSYFNPRAVRAEERDVLSRQAVAALRVYDQASQDIYRVGLEEAEASIAERPVEGRNNAPSYVPTLPHFVAQVKKDTHISFLGHVALPEEYGGSAAATGASEKQQLERLVVQLARALYRTALEFHQQPLRRVNRQKVLVSASLLDRFVAERWRLYCVSDTSSDAVRDVARRLSAFVPFEGRILDESGFPTDARVEDYERWMAAPPAA
ncbi:mitochondrial RNA binding complex 1 subunit [Novymonas esmeraldas]|uniref:Mitochondrial RNA binding complex 1 subunit n=1 Tax=Novymonas esmeraldas TaxID=1808958 RepID=A0AAW0F9K8_9TRYP